jgi:hypothetical protein
MTYNWYSLVFIGIHWYSLVFIGIRKDILISKIWQYCYHRKLRAGIHYRTYRRSDIVLLVGGVAPWEAERHLSLLNQYIPVYARAAQKASTGITSLGSVRSVRTRAQEQANMLA